MMRFVAGVLGSPDSLGIPTNNASTDALSSILNTVYFFAGAIAILMLVLDNCLVINSPDAEAEIC